MDDSTILVDVALSPGGNLAALVQDLESHGLEVEQTLKRLRIVRGTITRARLPELEALVAVKSVEPVRTSYFA